MKYSLAFNKKALKEWKKLPSDIKEQFKSKIQERLENPKIVSAKLRNFQDCYKIKLKASGYRLVYQVIDGEMVVIVIAVGKRDKNKIYDSLKNRV